MFRVRHIAFSLAILGVAASLPIVLADARGTRSSGTPSTRRSERSQRAGVDGGCERRRAR
jgi:hypothetical protein